MRFRRLRAMMVAHLVASILLLSIFTLAAVVTLDKALNYFTIQFGIDAFLFSTLVVVSKVLVLIGFVAFLIQDLVVFTRFLWRREVESVREADKPFFDRVDREITRRIAADKA